jgi:DNA transformation protein
MSSYGDEPGWVLVCDLYNLGPSCAKMLRKIGIETKADLEKAGAALAYRALKDVQPDVTAHLLYALEGALTGRHWAKLLPETKARLKREVEEAARIGPRFS